MHSRLLQRPSRRGSLFPSTCHNKKTTLVLGGSAFLSGVAPLEPLAVIQYNAGCICHVPDTVVWSVSCVANGCPGTRYVQYHQSRLPRGPDELRVKMWEMNVPYTCTSLMWWWWWCDDLVGTLAPPTAAANAAISAGGDGGAAAAFSYFPTPMVSFYICTFVVTPS